MSITIHSQHKCFAGTQTINSHFSTTLNCTMRFGLYLPPKASYSNVPVLYWLSGLTCTEENFIVKAGAQRVASELGLAIVAPDTSPRGVNIPHENDSYDFGSGAGFYVDATESPWASHYQMYSYITRELRELIANNYPILREQTGIFGHSMGGHGALTIAIKNPEHYKSVSAFAPICAASQSTWGKKALTGYLGENKNKWQDYDAVSLITSRGWKGSTILVDQGALDPYLTDNLHPELFEVACAEAKVPLLLRMQEGYDHSYYFISSFMEDHLRFHAENLRQ